MGSDPLEADRARDNPEDAVDALEQRVLGGPDHRLDDGHPDDVGPGEDADTGDQDPGDAAVFDLDLDPEDQGDADAVGPAPE